MLLAFGISYFIQYDFSSLAYFAPTQKVDDFRLSDFLMIVSRNSAPIVDEDIVIVDVGSCSRGQIISAIACIDSLLPRAIGLDVFFSYQESDDSLLTDIVRRAHNPVAPCIISSDGETDDTQLIKPYFVDETNCRTGVVNFMSSGIGNVVRNLNLASDVMNGDTIFSMPVAILQATDSLAFHRLLQRRAEDIEINYGKYVYTAITPDEINDNSELIRGRIVLIGNMSEAEDFHNTPVSGQMSGIEIHANALSTILHGDFVKHSSAWFDWVVAIMLCLAIVLFKYQIQDKPYCDITIRTTQIAVLWMIVVVGYWFYHRFGLIVNFSTSLLMVALGLMAKEIVDGAWWLIVTSWDKIGRLIKQ